MHVEKIICDFCGVEYPTHEDLSISFKHEGKIFYSYPSPVMESTGAKSDICRSCFLKTMRDILEEGEHNAKNIL